MERTMKSLEMNSRLVAFVILVILVLGLAPQNSLAQSVSASPVALATSVPTGTTYNVPPSEFPASGPEVLTVTITGATPSTPVTFSAVAVGASVPPLGSDVPADFIIDGSTCTGTFTSPSTCQVSLHFNASQQPRPTLETAALTVNSNAGDLTVPLSGAYGSIKLFGETDLAETPSTVLNPFTAPYTIATQTLSLTCPSPAAPNTGTISGTPDGTGYILVDNYITLATGPSLTPVTGIESNYPPGNVCSGSGATSGSIGNDDYIDCFTEVYENYAQDLPLPPPLGIDPDTFANPKNGILTSPRNEPNNGGVPPINVSSFLAGTNPEQVLFTLISEGTEEVYGNSTLFLATNCTAPGITSGASVTLNPVNTNNPASQTQTASLDSSPGQNISFTTSDAVAIESGTVTINSGIVPIITDFAVPQQLFSQLVSGTQGTSAAPAVCMRLSGELDYTAVPPAPMCKGYLLQCQYTNPTTGVTTVSGDNCTPTLSSVRNLFYAAQFASPDGPVGYNYLTTQSWSPETVYALDQTIVDSSGYVQLVTTPGTSGAGPTPPNFLDTVNGTTPDGSVTWTTQGLNACANAATWGTGNACAPGTGPGMLMGSDDWMAPQFTTNASIASGSTTLTSPSNPFTSGMVGSPISVSGAGASGATLVTTIAGYNGPGSVNLTASAVTTDNANGVVIIGQLSTSTPASPATFSTSNCVLTGSLTGELCPLDLLTQFEGAADPKGGSTTDGGNSILIAVANMPLPTAIATISGQNGSGWINSPAIAVANFTSTAAVYAGTAANPPANAFVPAAPFSLTYGASVWPTLPDTTYPVSTDLSNYNSFTNSSPTPPSSTFCNNSGTTPSPFTAGNSSAPAFFSGLGNGIYNLHYFTTDCAFTEGLVFNPAPSQLNNSAANWASFPYVTFGIETASAPNFSVACTPNSGTYDANITASCTVTDTNYVAGSADSGFACATYPCSGNPALLPNSIQGSNSSETVSVTTNVQPGTSNSTAYSNSVSICDLAGNCVTAQAGSFNITNPAVVTVTASSTSMTYGGAAPLITPSYYYPSGANVHSPATQPTCTTTATSLSPVSGNPYTTSCVGAADPDYTFVYVSGTFTVNPAGLSITASSAIKAYGTAAALTAFSTSGLLNTDSVTSVTLTSAGAAATATVAGSPYSIVPSAAVGSGLGNYTITYINGSLTVNPTVLSITATSVAKNYGTAIALTAFTTSGLLNTDSVSSVTLTSAGAAATATVAGSPYQIVPSAAVGTGLGNYTITYINGSLTVNPTGLSITATSVAKNYGTAAALTAFTTSGLAPSDSVSSVTLTSAGAAATATIAGSPYPIVPSAAVGTGLGNYTITYINGSLTVNPTALSITAGNVTKNYGTAAALTAFTTSGLLNSDSVSSVTLTSSGAAAGATVAGSPYAIVPSAAVGTGLGNYTITYKIGSLTVNPVALVITASSPTITQGTTPVITASYSGFVNSQSSTNLTTQPTCTTSATSSSPAGTYATSCSGAVDTNYTITYVAGLLTINPATPSLKVTPGSLTFRSKSTPLYPGQSGVPQFITVTNTGSTPAVISSVTIGGTNSYDFGDVSFCAKWFTKMPGTLPAGASCVIGVDAWQVAAPPDDATTPFTATAYLAITPQGGSTTNVALTTYVINPVPKFTATKLTFPTTTTGNSSELTVTVTNTGTTPLIFGTPSIGGNGPFAVAAGTTCTGATIEPAGVSGGNGTSCVINVTFTPTKAGTFNANLCVMDNAQNEQTITLSGTE
jgi:mucin-19